jgi:hypothetical protein
MPEAVIHGETGLLVPPRDQELLEKRGALKSGLNRVGRIQRLVRSWTAALPQLGLGFDAIPQTGSQELLSNASVVPR